ncbi:hypothetical protein MYX84_16560 [Acidobacteria bacterium AH-259-O06]|nr:hypothetical protein [Acidobacteria bacterium AH-259-O06]
MPSQEEKLEQIDQIVHQIIDDWYERVKENYVTEEDSRELGVEPEVKCFHDSGNHRLKFSREKELDVTYGLGVKRKNERLVVEASVNNKSEGFDYGAFVNKLKSHYWRSRNEKPWTDPDFDHFTYQDLLPFEPLMGQSVTLDMRKERADIIRLSFEVNPHHEDLLLRRKDVLRDLIENYCVAPLKRIYAESYREL